MSRPGLTSTYQRLFIKAIKKPRQLKITGSHQTLYNITYFSLAFEQINFYKIKNFISMFSLK